MQNVLCTRLQARYDLGDPASRPNFLSDGHGLRLRLPRAALAAYFPLKSYSRGPFNT